MYSDSIVVNLNGFFFRKISKTVEWKKKLKNHRFTTELSHLSAIMVKS